MTTIGQRTLFKESWRLLKQVRKLTMSGCCLRVLRVNKVSSRGRRRTHIYLQPEIEQVSSVFKSGEFEVGESWNLELLYGSKNKAYLKMQTFFHVERSFHSVLYFM